MQIQFVSKYNAWLYSGLVDKTVAFSCPQARELPDGRVIVPNDHKLLQQLVKRHIPIGMPMSGYDWPSAMGLKPWRAQRFMANFLVANPNCFNLSEMRTGKTLGALWAADFIMQREPGIKTLIVGQLSTLRPTWGDAIFENFMGRRSFAILTGSAERRSRLLDTDCDFYIINYEGVGVGATRRKAKIELEGFARKLAERLDIQIVIIDEASAYRDAGSLRHKVGRIILSGRKYVWLMTGTPTPKDPVSAYGLRKLLEPNWQETKTNFQNRTMLQVSNFKWVPRNTAAETVAKTLVPAIRFKQSDCFDSPQQVIERRQVELSIEQLKYYREMKRELALTLKGKDVNAVNEAALRMKLLQISGGAVYDDQHGAHNLDVSPRMKVLKEIIDEAPTKVIVFAPLTAVVDLITLCLIGLKVPHVVVDGRQKTKRDELLTAFKRHDGLRVLVGHPGPIARGLDLTSAATIVWYLPTDNPEDWQQGNERINGSGQKYLRTVVQMFATSVEREIFRRLENNQSLQGAMLKLLEE